MSRHAKHVHLDVENSLSQISTSMSERAIAELGHPEDMIDQAMIVSAMGFRGNSWMQYSSTNHFPSSQFIEAIRIRCGALSVTSSHCQCGKPLDGNKQHVLSCQKNTTYTSLHRHNEILHALNHTANKYGVMTIVEPRLYFGEDKRRPDITFILGRNHLATDITVVNPCCPTYLPHAASTPGHAAFTAAEHKEQKHGSNVEALGHRFVPLAIEAFGHFDALTERILSCVTDELPSFLCKHFVKEAYQNMACATQKGNAQIVLNFNHRLVQL